MSDMSEIIKESLEGIKSFADTEVITGTVINTPSGVTIIPISKLTVGFAGGGFDYGQKRLPQGQGFGSGSGTGISITPIAFLTVKQDSSVNLIPLNDDRSNIDKIFSAIERSPEIIEKIRNTLS